MISRQVQVKINKNEATIKDPVVLYEGDYGVELYFTITKFQYKFSPTGENILSTINDEILEAYTTIVNPLGDELSQQNGEVVNDTIKFVVTEDLTDELTEIGQYKLQFHLVCVHSEVSIPPVEFTVRERLKGVQDFVDAIVGTGIVGKCRIEYE